LEDLARDLSNTKIEVLTPLYGLNTPAGKLIIASSESSISSFLSCLKAFEG